ncbi:MAG: hypothetical protein L6R43_12440 [Planctomycetes bacterium]|nr:hypothetical protein [Planctomycetota bacterium]
MAGAGADVRCRERGGSRRLVAACLLGTLLCLVSWELLLALSARSFGASWHGFLLSLGLREGAAAAAALLLSGFAAARLGNARLPFQRPAARRPRPVRNAAALYAGLLVGVPLPAAAADLLEWAGLRVSGGRELLYLLALLALGAAAGALAAGRVRGGGNPGLDGGSEGA